MHECGHLFCVNGFVTHAHQPPPPRERHRKKPLILVMWKRGMGSKQGLQMTMSPTTPHHTTPHPWPKKKCVQVFPPVAGWLPGVASPGPSRAPPPGPVGALAHQCAQPTRRVCPDPAVCGAWGQASPPPPVAGPQPRVGPQLGRGGAPSRLSRVPPGTVGCGSSRK